MPNYCITMERTLRIAKWFDAKDDAEACERANLIHLQTDDYEYEGGDSEYDYSLVCTENGNELIPWY